MNLLFELKNNFTDETAIFSLDDLVNNDFETVIEPLPDFTSPSPCLSNKLLDFVTKGSDVDPEELDDVRHMDLFYADDVLNIEIVEFVKVINNEQTITNENDERYALELINTLNKYTDQFIGNMYAFELLTQIAKNEDDATAYYDQLDYIHDDLDCEKWMEFNDEFFENYFANDPLGAAKATYIGKIYSWNDTYVTFDGYANLKTTDEIPYQDEFSEIVDCWLEEKL